MQLDFIGEMLGRAAGVQIQPRKERALKQFESIEEGCIR